MRDVDSMEKTALVPIIDLALNTNISYIKDIIDLLYVKERKSSGKSYLAESRYKGIEKIIRGKKYEQVIELGAGFTPHALNLCDIVKNYIEIDYPDNSQLKKQIIQSINPKLKTKCICGNIFEDKTWNGILRQLLSLKTIIFCEGFMQYASKKQRAYLALKIKPILREYGGVFVFEDSLTFHPEFSEIKALKDLSVKMSRLSKRNNLLDYISQEQLTDEWEKLGFKVERIQAPYKKGEEIESFEYDSIGLIVLSNFAHWKLSLEDN